MKPCIFVHKGNSNYLDSVFSITRKFNPTNRLILLGDNSNKLTAKKYKIEFYPIEDYIQPIPYYHFSTNEEEYEKFCFERWFVIKNFCLAHDVREFIHSDSDNAFFVDVNLFNYTNARIGAKGRVVVPNVLFINTIYLAKICTYYIQLFSRPKLSFVQEISEFAKKDHKNNIVLYTDMFFLNQAITKLNLEFETLSEDNTPYIFNANIDKYEITVKGVEVFKKGTEFQLVNLHFAEINKHKAQELENIISLGHNRMFDFVDKVIYINLDNRPDRKERLLSDLLQKIPKHKIVRFSAIKHTPGWIGCAKSHIAVLDMAQKNNWKNILVLEDDAIMNKPDKVKTGYENLEKIVNGNWDGICLGLLNAKYDSKTMRITQSLSTVAYMVNRSYFDTLKKNFEEALTNLEKTKEYSVYAIDQWWWKLMKTDKWFGTMPSIFVQNNTFSDISGIMYKAKDNYI
jgi:glycosyl transferase family 25